MKTPTLPWQERAEVPVEMAATILSRGERSIYYEIDKGIIPGWAVSRRGQRTLVAVRYLLLCRDGMTVTVSEASAWPDVVLVPVRELVAQVATLTAQLARIEAVLVALEGRL